MTAMHQFRDKADRTWEIALTIGDVKRVKGALAVNLLDPMAIEDGLPLVSRLHLDPILLVDVLFVLLSRQAEAFGLDDAGFADALGPIHAYAAWEAFQGEWVLFSRGLRREAEARAIETNAELVKRQAAMRIEILDKATATVGALVERSRQAAAEKLDSLARGTSPMCIASPASSGSIPPA